MCIDLAYFVSFQTTHGIANGQVSQVSEIGPEFDPVSVTKKRPLNLPQTRLPTLQGIGSHPEAGH